MSPLAGSKGVGAHDLGALSMAHAGKNTGGSQFFIDVAPQPSLDQGGYTVFGTVIKGMDVVEKIEVGDAITKASLASRRRRNSSGRVEI